jgi:hypothetical protein
MPPLPIDVECRKHCDSPEARSARKRRYSVDPARREWYRLNRARRYAARFFS